MFCLSFNTTIVSVELKYLIKLHTHILSFNTTIVSVELRWFIKKNSVWLVSIQPLFRWNDEAHLYFTSVIEFQYNHCFGGTKLEEKIGMSLFISFNTTIVSVELKWEAQILRVMGGFQYNHCFGGTINSFYAQKFEGCFNTTIVSVEQNSLCF